MVKLTDQQKEELKALEAIPEDQIDLSDIPELTEEERKNARKFSFYQPDWQLITLRLDRNVINWFEKNAENDDEAAKVINQVLMEHMRKVRFPNKKTFAEVEHQTGDQVQEAQDHLNSRNRQ